MFKNGKGYRDQFEEESKIFQSSQLNTIAEVINEGTTRTGTYSLTVDNISAKVIEIKGYQISYYILNQATATMTPSIDIKNFTTGEVFVTQTPTLPENTFVTQSMFISTDKISMNDSVGITSADPIAGTKVGGTGFGEVRVYVNTIYTTKGESII